MRYFASQIWKTSPHRPLRQCRTQTQRAKNWSMRLSGTMARGGSREAAGGVKGWTSLELTKLQTGLVLGLTAWADRIEYSLPCWTPHALNRCRISRARKHLVLQLPGPVQICFPPMPPGRSTPGPTALAGQRLAPTPRSPGRASSAAWVRACVGAGHRLASERQSPGRASPAARMRAQLATAKGCNA